MLIAVIILKNNILQRKTFAITPLFRLKEPLSTNIILYFCTLDIYNHFLILIFSYQHYNLKIRYQNTLLITNINNFGASEKNVARSLSITGP